jgi:hypothetical protein
MSTSLVMFDSQLTGVNLWSEDIPEKTLVVMSGNDVLVDSQTIQNWLLEKTQVHQVSAERTCESFKRATQRGHVFDLTRGKAPCPKQQMSPLRRRRRRPSHSIRMPCPKGHVH